MLRALLAIGILLGVIVGCAPASLPAAEKPSTPLIEDSYGLDNYLAKTAPGNSPIDALSSPAKRRFVASFRAGRPSTAELTAELTHDEAFALLALFGYEAATPSHLRPKRLSIGNSETSAASALFDAFDSLLYAPKPYEAVAAYARDYAPQQSEAMLRKLSDGDLALLARAALLVVSIDAKASTDDVVRDIDELERRGVAAPGWSYDLYNTLLSRRDYTAARNFREHHATMRLPPAPDVRDETSGIGPTVLALHGDGTLSRRTLLLDPHAQVIVVAGCHFSKDAALAIEKDAILRALFSRQVVWITPATQDPTDPELMRWNREHPLAAMTTVYRESEWPEIDTWNMPSFYFFRDGHLEAKVSGWQPDKVLDGFRKIGLGR